MAVLHRARGADVFGCFVDDDTQRNLTDLNFKDHDIVGVDKAGNEKPGMDPFARN